MHTIRSIGRAFWAARGPTRLAFLALALVAVVVPKLALALTGPMLVGNTTVTSLNEAMKVVTSIPLVKQYVAESEFLSMFKTETNVQTETQGTGRYIETANWSQLPAGIGMRNETDYLPEPTAPKFLNGRIYLKKLTGVLEMTGDTMKRVNNDTEAFLNWLDESMPAFAERVAHESDRIAMGFGSGVKARIANLSVTKGGYTFTNGKSPYSGGKFAITVDRALGITGYSGAALQFMEGDRIVFTDSLVSPVSLRSAGTLQSAIVDQVDDDNDLLVLIADTALRSAVAASDYIALGDKAGHGFPDDTGTDREFMGMLGHVDDGGIIPTYFNISRATNPRYRSIIIDASGTNFNGVLTEDLAAYADDQVNIKSGGKIDTIVANRGAVRGYWRSLRGDRFFIDPRSMQGGKAATLSILLGDRTATIKVARKLPPEVAFGLETAGFLRITPNAWEWDDTTGSIFKPVTDTVGRKDQFYAFGTAYEQLFNKTPRRNVRVDNLITQF